MLVYMDTISDVSMVEREGVMVALTRRGLVQGVSPGIGCFAEVFALPGLPQPNSIPDEYPNLILYQRTARLVDTGSVFSVEVTFEYRSLMESDVNFIFSGSSGLESKKVYKDRFGQPILLQYTYPIDHPRHPGETVTVLGSVDSEKQIHNMSATGIIKIDSPALLTSQWEGWVNSEMWLDGAPGAWKCTNVTWKLFDASTTPASYLFTFEFSLHADGDWQPEARFQDPDDGTIPYDLVQGVGIKTVVLYPSRDFNERFPSYSGE